MKKNLKVNDAYALEALTITEPTSPNDLPIATTTTLGTVIVGDNLTVTPQGRLSASAQAAQDNLTPSATLAPSVNAVNTRFATVDASLNTRFAAVDASLNTWVTWRSEITLSALTIVEGAASFDKRYLLETPAITVNPFAPSSGTTPPVGSLITFRIRNTGTVSTISFRDALNAQLFIVNGANTTVSTLRLLPGETVSFRVSSSTTIETVHFLRRPTITKWETGINVRYVVDQMVYTSQNKYFRVKVDIINPTTEPTVSDANYEQIGITLPAATRNNQVLTYNLDTVTPANNGYKWTLIMDSSLDNAITYANIPNYAGQTIQPADTLKTAIQRLESRAGTLHAVGRYHWAAAEWRTQATHQGLFSIVGDTEVGYIQRADSVGINNNITCYGGIHGGGFKILVNSTVTFVSIDYLRDAQISGTGSFILSTAGGPNGCNFSFITVRSDRNITTLINTTCRLQGYVSTGAHTISYGGTLIIHSNCDLTGVTLIKTGSGVLVDQRTIDNSAPPVGFTGPVAPYYVRTEYETGWWIVISGSANRVVSSYNGGGNMVFPNGSGASYSEYVGETQTWHLKPLWCKRIRGFYQTAVNQHNLTINIKRTSTGTIVATKTLIFNTPSLTRKAGGIDKWTPDFDIFLPGYDSYILEIVTIPTTNSVDGAVTNFWFHGDYIID